MKVNKSLTILGIESSCDETAAAVLEVTAGRFLVKSNVVLSQIPIHRKFGGVVPEVAARKHLENILPVIEEALNSADLTMAKIDRLAVTRGPGLITSLMVGVNAAKTLSYVYGKPLVGINHLEGHMLVNLVQSLPPARGGIKGGGSPMSNLKFPALCLIVSGGHTELILIKKIGQYKKIGQTLDDAAGECFDKTAKILGLGYPGGPIISVRAKNGDRNKFDLPRPMINDNTFNFSFSGLKTSVLYKLEKIKPLGKKELNDFCASVEQAIIDVLVSKTIKAAIKYKVKTVMLGGGVAANYELRKQLEEKVKEELPKVKYQMPNIKYCSDNAVMAAVAGYFNQPKKDAWRDLGVDPNLEIGS